jgi:electron transfer flavoprotein beta subunit
MNILVCVSRVPDSAARILVGDDGRTIDPQGIKYVVNPYDEFAIEEVLILKEKNGGTVTTITVGQEASKEQLRTSLAMGADKAVLVKTNKEFDSFFVANNIAEYAKQMNPDIIFLGRQSIDMDSLQLPSMLGELLNLPSVSVVSKTTYEEGKVIAERDIEGGKEVVETTIPCIISAQKGLNDPRYPKLPDIMKARSKPIEEVDAIDSDSRVSISKIEIPVKQRAGVILGGEDTDIDELVRLLHEDAKVI